VQLRRRHPKRPLHRHRRAQSTQGPDLSDLLRKAERLRAIGYQVARVATASLIVYGALGIAVADLLPSMIQSSAKSATAI